MTVDPDVRLARYERNGRTITVQEQKILAGKRICVVGCGGLGGYVIEMLARAGVGSLTVMDGDAFDASNLNRQLLADPEVIGQNKALVAARRVRRVNDTIQVQAESCFLTADNGLALLRGHDGVVDALDSIEARLMLEDLCEPLGIPLVHGAIAGWFGQVTTIFPGDQTLHRIYPPNQQRGIEQQLGNPSFTPALVASLQCAELIKLLLGKGELLRRKVLLVDALANDFQVLDLARS
jgi:molybdopterin/thiamine biosynthesis adenylyltransferase